LGWVLAWTVAGYQRDEVYIGTAENVLLRTTLMMTNSSTWDLDTRVNSRFY
jgi:hypothetical protein